MKSVCFMLSACVAISNALDASGTCNDADGSSLLQARKLVRMKSKATDAETLLNSMRGVAKSLTKHAAAEVMQTPEEVNAALEEANTVLQTMFPLLAQQHELAQKEINDAVRAVEACHNQHGGATAARLNSAVSSALATKEECEETLAQEVETERRDCEGAGDNPNCLCDEARTRVADQTTLCNARTETYEVAFCEREMMEDTLEQCHHEETDVYDLLRADMEEAMLARQQEYIAFMQVNCLMGLITTAMSTGTPIDDASLVACDDVNVDALRLNFPEPPAAPVPTRVQPGDPVCSDDDAHVISDDVYIATWLATGCPNPEPPADVVNWWRSVGWERTFRDMHAYCNLAATDRAITRQYNTCCGQGQQCAPANCAEQTTWAVSGDVPDGRYLATWLATGCPNSDPQTLAIDWWRGVGPVRTFADMHAYCNLVATGRAIPRQINMCCGSGQECTPTNCALQVNFA